MKSLIRVKLFSFEFRVLSFELDLRGKLTEGREREYRIYNKEWRISKVREIYWIRGFRIGFPHPLHSLRSFSGCHPSLGCIDLLIIK